MSVLSTIDAICEALLIEWCDTCRAQEQYQAAVKRIGELEQQQDKAVQQV